VPEGRCYPHDDDDGDDDDDDYNDDRFMMITMIRNLNSNSNYRCVDEATCLKDYFIPMLTTQSDYCQRLDTGTLPDILACHLCCHGNACNVGLVPSSLYEPGA
jgi:hypothetical protein